MNRRSFLSTSAAASIGSIAWATSTSRFAKAQSGTQGPDTNLINSATTAHAIQTANCYAGISPYTDWYNLASVHRSICTDYQNKNLDAIFIPAVQQMSASQFSLNAIDQNAIVAAIQPYQPSFALADVQMLFAALPTDSVSIQNALIPLQTQGLAPLLSLAGDKAFELGGYIYRATRGTAGGPSNLVMSPMSTPHPTQPFRKEFGGGGGYNCKTDGAILVGLGISFAVLAFMAAPEIGILAASFWGPTVTWGGIASGGWIAGHAIACGF